MLIFRLELVRHGFSSKRTPSWPVERRPLTDEGRSRCGPSVVQALSKTDRYKFRLCRCTETFDILYEVTQC